MDNIMVLALAATAAAKVVVDIVKLAVPNRPVWLAPVVAVILSPVLIILLEIGQKVPLTPDVVANCILAGILTAGAAVGVTELGRRADAPVVPHG